MSSPFPKCAEPPDAQNSDALSTSSDLLDLLLREDLCSAAGSARSRSGASTTSGSLGSGSLGCDVSRSGTGMLVAVGAPECWGSGRVLGQGFLVRLQDSHMRYLGILDFSHTPGTQLHLSHRPHVLRAQHQVHTRPNRCPAGAQSPQWFRQVGRCWSCPSSAPGGELSPGRRVGITAVCTPP